MLSSLVARSKKALLLLVPGGFALYVSGSRLNYVKVLGRGNETAQK
jgi:hypothetical protein